MCSQLQFTLGNDVLAAVAAVGCQPFQHMVGGAVDGNRSHYSSR
jgi:hypothetical protein